MTPPRFLDTNILLYSISADSAETAKRDVAISLLEDDNSGLSVQVLQEFYVQSTRATRRDAIPHQLAVELIQTWLRFKIQEITLDVMQNAFKIRSMHGLSYWDAAIVAAARALGCRELVSEDMGHGREIEGITITNPFR